MRMLPRTQCDPESWERFCDRANEAWLFHRWKWLEIERRYATVKEHSFALVGADGAIFAVLPLYEYRLGLGGWVETLLASGQPRQAGPALLDGLAASEHNAARTMIINTIAEIAEQIDADRVQLDVQSLSPRWRNATRFDIPFWFSDRRFERGPLIGAQGLVPSPGLSSYALEQIVRLQMPLEELRGGLDAACRRAIRKAQGSGLTTSVESGGAAISEFYDLAKRSAARTGEQLPDIEYYRSIDAALAETMRSRIVFVRHEGKAASALFVVIDKQAMSFLANVSDVEGHQLRANDLVHWTAITWARQEGLELYRLGPYIPQIPADTPVGRVTRFKAKFANLQYEALTASWYRNAEKYRDLGVNYIVSRCS